MTNAEPLAKIKAEIERLKTVQLKRIQEGDLVDAEPYDKIEAYNELLSFISTLESKKPVNREMREKDFDNECHRYFNGMTPEQFLNTPNTVIARHFAQWGYLRAAEKADEIEYNRQRAEESVPKDLEEAAERFSKNVSNGLYFRDLRVGFIAGAKWQKEQDEKEQADLFTIVALDAAQRAKEQMMKEAVDADVNTYRDIVAGKSWAEFVVEMPTSDLGDKVRIIILPKESEQ